MKENIKHYTSRIRNKLLIRIKAWKSKNFIKTSGVIYWIVLLLISWDITKDIGGIIAPKWLGYTLVMGGCLLTGILIKLVGTWLLTLVVRVLTDKYYIDELIALVGMMIVVIGASSYFALKVSKDLVVGIAIVIGILGFFYFKSLWSLCFGKRVTRYNISVVCLGTILTIAGVIFLRSEGFEDTYIKTYLQMSQVRDELDNNEIRTFKRAIANGRYTVASTAYDLEKEELTSGTVSLKSYAQNKGMTGYIKKRYQGYDLDKVPMRGKIWYPKEAVNCPALWMIHGNHDYKEESYLGYEYLGRFLASHGYVMISVDENACNLLTNENDARAILLLENIKQVLEYNETEENPLFGKINEDKIAIGGHSRGGEAVNIAYLMNKEGINPGNGRIKYNYNFNISSIIAIAPTVDQYKPTNKSITLEDVNYLVIHGANDQDVYQFSGLKQYKNIQYTGEGEYIKSALYCAGCNHGQFNSRWGIYDRTGLYRKALNVKNFVSENEQQRIAEIFIKIFLDYTLKERKDHIKLLKDCNLYKAYLPETLYIQCYQTSDYIPLCDFEEDINLESGTMEEVRIDVVGGDIWTEGIYPSEVPNSNSAMYLAWSQHRLPTVTIYTPDINLLERNLQFDVMDLRENFSEEDIYIQDVQIVVEDKEGNSARVSLRDYATLYPPLMVRLNKLQYLLGKVEYKHQFQTVTIPAYELVSRHAQMTGGTIDITHIRKIKFTFYGESGKVALDQIGY